MNSHGGQVGGALWDGVRGAFLIRPRAGAFDVGLAAAVTLSVVAMGAVAALDVVLAGRGWRFNPQGLIVQATYFAALATLLCVVPFRRGGVEPGQLFVGVVAVSTVLTALAALVGAAVRLMPIAVAGNSIPAFPLLAVAADLGVSIVSMGAFGVAVLLLPVALVRLGFGLAQRGRIAVGLGLALTQVLAMVTFSYSPMATGRDTTPFELSLLQVAVDTIRPPRPEPQDAEETRPRIDAERAMTRQPELLASALGTLEPARAARPEFYFLGFAPYASQDVFKREITAVKGIFDERFGTAGRSVTLVNHRDTVETMPLASMTNLNGALRRIGQLMRPDRDVLVLFVTSHGNKGRIAVEFPGFPLNGLTPERLAVALDAAGIVNRVLVLSACHSGSFVERLKSDTTLIMTAAHADKTSFGCSNENEWTYFGDAYFNRTLRTGGSLIEAFGTARGLIEAWEKRDGLEPSEPQIFVGSGIGAKLDAVAAALAGGANAEGGVLRPAP